MTATVNFSPGEIFGGDSTLAIFATGSCSNVVAAGLLEKANRRSRMERIDSFAFQCSCRNNRSAMLASPSESVTIHGVLLHCTAYVHEPSDLNVELVSASH